VDTFASFDPPVHRIHFHDNEEEDFKLEEWVRVFLPCSGLFKCVRSLTLPYFGWGTAAAVEARSNFLLASALVIGYGRLDTADVSRLALQFPLLDRLDLEQIAWGDDSIGDSPSQVVPNDVGPFSNLGCLTICGDIKPIILYTASSLWRGSHPFTLFALRPLYTKNGNLSGNLFAFWRQY
jgi:hypothetical protein